MSSVTNLPSVTGLGKGDEQPPELFKKSELTDITLVVEGKELHFVKYLLMEGSGVLAKMIKTSADPSRLKIDDLTYKDMIIFLECLHPKCFRAITDTNLEQVTTIAHKFEYERIISICEQYIIQKFRKVRTTQDRMYPQFFFHLRIADKCGLKKAIEVGVSSKQAELAYFSSKIHHEQEDECETTKLARLCCELQGKPLTLMKGYEDDIDFSQLSWETKFKFVSRRLREAEERIPLDNLY